MVESNALRILFVCVENAGRSQMAEAFFKEYAPKTFHVISAGTAPLPELHPLVIQVMQEIGINLDKQEPKLLSQSIIDDSFVTINMGCMDKESCPSSLSAKNMVDWNIPDPKDKSVNEIRQIRDQIKYNVIALVDSFKEG